ncbi:hypothetical protein E2562_003651 [Oryza meyeriana var. granulata]|uniref:DnaJ homologue subfamily C GRV2/DNAJC13 N-terminal domain-containing protein n=1 Tax=Oryza meyeriana var. granulata TaxID=110450 RepID=A0A6G1C474_9ORYZ|nr:hypothetical protein E2562_003651 [Oryza meyeriana var. granulata]
MAAAAMGGGEWGRRGHSWRGRYRRILCIAFSGLVTLDPATLAVTNSYDVTFSFDRATPESNAAEFMLSVRTDAHGKFKAFRFSSPLRARILTELHRLRPVHPVVEFPVLHLRRRTHEWAPFKSQVAPIICNRIDLNDVLENTVATKLRS